MSDYTPTESDLVKAWGRNCFELGGRAYLAEDCARKALEKMKVDARSTQEPTEEQVEAAARAFYEDPSGLTNWYKMSRVEPWLADRYRAAIRRALLAAQEAGR